MKLGTLLLRDAVITLNQLEAALRNQILCGGRLGTNLVELDFVDLDTLTRCLAQIRGVPAATQTMFEEVDKTVLDAFGAELAERYDVFPLGPIGDGNRLGERDDPGEPLAVALVDPDDATIITKLEENTGRPISAHIAPELRIYYYLEKHYGISRKARFVRAGKARPLPDEATERRRTQPARGIATPPAVRLEPSRKTSAPDRFARVVTTRPSMSYRDACSAIDVAESRDAIADVFIDFAHGRFELAVVFLLRDANAIGWRAYTASSADDPDVDLPGVDTLSLPLGGASALQEAHDSRVPYRGGPTSAGKPIERTLWQHLGPDSAPADGPAEMLVVPVVVKRRVVNLIYAHGLDHDLVDDTAAKKLGELAKRASRAYSRLIQAAKNPS